MAVVEADDPQVRLAALEQELARASFDAETGVAGAAAKVRGIQQAITETRALIERREYAERERVRRTEDDCATK